MWHKHGVKPPHSSHRSSDRPDRGPRPPLDGPALDALALRYVGRFATSRGKLRDYLARKVRERGWGGDMAPDIDAIAERLASLGYISDAVFALSKARTMSGRGLGARRVAEALHVAGISMEDGESARRLANDERVEAALHLARKRRVGPFATGSVDAARREKAIAAMIRGGHGYKLARAIVELESTEDIDLEALAEVN